MALKIYGRGISKNKQQRGKFQCIKVGLCLALFVEICDEGCGEWY